MIPLIIVITTVVAAALWQWDARSYQTVDIGSPFDDGYTSSFHKPEESTFFPDMDFRWSRAESRVRLWGSVPRSPARLTLTMLAPPHPEGAQPVHLDIAGLLSTTVAVSPQPRRFMLLLPAASDDSHRLTIRIATDTHTLHGESRSLGTAVDRVSLDVMGGRPAATDVLRELWRVPFLPAGVLLLALSAALARLPSTVVGGGPALVLLVLIFAGVQWPALSPLLAYSVASVSGVVCGVLVVAHLLRRFPRILPTPTTDRRAFGWIVAVFVLVFVATFEPIIRSDGIGYYAYLRSLTMDGDLRMGNDFHLAVETFQRQFLIPPPNERGYTHNPWSVGPALMWFPLYMVAHALVVGGQSVGLSWQASGYDSPYITLSMATSVLAGLGTLLVCYRICRRFVSPAVAVLAVLSIFTGSNLLYYVLREGSFSHALASLATACFVLVWFKLEEQPSLARWALLGLTAGWMVLLYWLSAILLLPAAMTWARFMVRAATRTPATHPHTPPAGQTLLGGAVAALLVLLLFSPQMFVWYTLYGSLLTVPQGNDYITPDKIHLVALLFSTRHGLLPWTPALFVGVASLPLLWNREPARRWYTVCLLASAIAYILYNALISDWHGSGAFGLRRLTVLVPWGAIGLALCYDWLRQWHRSLPLVLAALGSTWVTLLMIRYDLHFITRMYDPPYGLPVFYLSYRTLPWEYIAGWQENTYLVSRFQPPVSPEAVTEGVVLVLVLALVIGIVGRWWYREHV